MITTGRNECGYHEREQALINKHSDSIMVGATGTYNEKYHINRRRSSEQSSLFTRNVTLFFIIFFVLAVGFVNAQARIGAEESNKLVIEKTNPVYPPLAKVAGMQGTVRLDLIISEAGAVISAKVIEGHPLLKDAAVEAAKKSKYRPYLVNGKAVPFITTVEIGRAHV